MKQASISFKLAVFLTVGVFVPTLVCVDLLKVRHTIASELGLPEPMELLLPSVDYSCPVLRGLRIDPRDLLNLTFYVDGWDEDIVSPEKASELIGYFLAGLTVPESDIWVNLSPYEDSRIIPDFLGQTALGRDLVGQDYVLKQLAASVTSPGTKGGERYWRDLSARLDESSNAGNDPISSYNKVWIVPDKAAIRDDNGLGIVSEASLKVMTEEDYVAHEKLTRPIVRSGHDRLANGMPDYLRRDVEQDVNHGRNFSRLRQIYYALILAKWFKAKVYGSFFTTNKRLTPHDFRHSLVTEMALANMPIRDVMSITGHTDINVLLRHYSHSTEAGRRQVLSFTCL